MNSFPRLLWSWLSGRAMSWTILFSSFNRRSERADAWVRRHDGLLPHRGRDRPHMRLAVITDEIMLTVDLDGYALDDFPNLLDMPTDRIIWFLERVQATKVVAEIKTKDAQKARSSLSGVRADLSDHARRAPRDSRGRFVTDPTAAKPKRRRRTLGLGSRIDKLEKQDQ